MFGMSFVFWYFMLAAFIFYLLIARDYCHGKICKNRKAFFVVFAIFALLWPLAIALCWLPLDLWRNFGRKIGLHNN